MGIGIKINDPKKHKNAPFAALKSKNFLGEDTQTPLRETVSFSVHPPLSFSDFFAKTHSDP